MKFKYLINQVLKLIPEIIDPTESWYCILLSLANWFLWH